MSGELDAYVRFLGHLGVSAQITVDHDGTFLFQMPTAQYEPRRKIIDPWFTLVSHCEDQSFFRERPRGTGTTHY